jgi:hypothetical protein
LRRSYFAAKGMHSKASIGTCKSRREYNIYCRLYCTDLSRSYNLIVGTEIEARYNIEGGRTVWIFEVSYNKIGTEIEEKGTTRGTGLYCTDFDSPYCCFCCTEIEENFCVYFLSFGTFPKASYSIYCPNLCCSIWHRFRGNRTTKEAQNRGADLYICAGNSGTNFEEFGSDFDVKAWHGFRDKFVIKFLKLLTAVKDISSTSEIIKTPSLTGFPLVGFSRVVVRPKISV